jgi:hypothetical protein
MALECFSTSITGGQDKSIQVSMKNEIMHHSASLSSFLLLLVKRKVFNP